MTQDQFDDGIGALYAKKADKKIFAYISPNEEDAILIEAETGIRFYEEEAGILIPQGKTFYYLPYDTIIALKGER